MVEPTMSDHRGKVCTCGDRLSSLKVLGSFNRDPQAALGAFYKLVADAMTQQVCLRRFMISSKEALIRRIQYAKALLH
jgi:hypothetical protein